MTWSAQDTRRAAKTPARCCWFNCSCRLTKAHSLRTLSSSCSLQHLLFSTLKPAAENWAALPASVVCLGRFRRTPRLPDGERDLGSSWSGELWRRLRSQEQTRRVRQADHLHRLLHQHGTGAQGVWPSESELVWENCSVGQLSVIVPHPTSEISILENGLSDGTNN